MSDEQTVIDKTDTEAKPSGEVDNALDSLDSTLNEWDAKANPAPAPTAAAAKPGQDDTALINDYVKRQIDKENRAETQTDIDASVTRIKGSLKDVEAPDIAVKGILYAEVEESPEKLAAWQARKTNPGAWDQVLKGVRDRVQKEYVPLPDKDLTDDRDAVSAAIHSASKHTAQEVEVDWASMGDQEFQNAKMALERQSRKK